MPRYKVNATREEIYKDSRVITALDEEMAKEEMSKRMANAPDNWDHNSTEEHFEAVLLPPTCVGPESTDKLFSVTDRKVTGRVWKLFVYATNELDARMAAAEIFIGCKANEVDPQVFRDICDDLIVTQSDHA